MSCPSIVIITTKIIIMQVSPRMRTRMLPHPWIKCVFWRQIIQTCSTSCTQNKLFKQIRQIARREAATIVTGTIRIRKTQLALPEQVRSRRADQIELILLIVSMKRIILNITRTINRGVSNKVIFRQTVSVSTRVFHKHSLTKTSRSPDHTVHLGTVIS